MIPRTCSSCGSKLAGRKRHGWPIGNLILCAKCVRGKK